MDKKKSKSTASGSSSPSTTTKPKKSSSTTAAASLPTTTTSRNAVLPQTARKLEAVGDTVEPFHFILHPKDEQSLTRENQNKGKELYSLLVHHEIIQGDTIRKRFRNNSQERDKIEKIIRNDLDPSIADPLISLLNKDIRSFKKRLKANLKDFIDLQDLQDQENVPKDKSWWDWNGFAVTMIGLVQVIAEAVLVAFGLTQIGNALISEGVSNMAELSGTFSWKEWAIQKAISFGLSMLTVGIGKFLMDKIMEQIQENVIQKIVSKIEENLLKGVIGLINNKIETLYLQKKTLGKDILLPQQFDNIRTRVVSSLRNSYHVFADGLKKSNSKYVKIAATTLKAIDIINNYLREAKDKDRALGLADIKMLADRKRRKITVYNSDTGEKEIINPSEVRKIPALFKQSAKIYYEADENGDIGHYFTG
ncbi:unnamed protein product [Rotaria sp. Silwood1]|nr:unnamed protein product [Rotaria sp. Silwood1]